MLKSKVSAPKTQRPLLEASNTEMQHGDKSFSLSLLGKLSAHIG